MEIRSICFVGHTGCGKTTLAEALLKKGGLETKLDFTPEEKARGFSIDLGIGYLKNINIDIIDSPGFAEFIEEVYKGLRVAETALLVINAEKGVEVHTEKVWEVIKDLKKPSVVFINKMDLENADFDKAVDQLRDLIEGLVFLQLPIREGNFVGVVDLIENQASYFNKQKGKGEIPHELEAQAAKERERLLESLAEVDDDLMELFLEEEEVPEEKIKAAIGKGLRDGVITPVVCGSAKEDLGIEQLMSLFELTPPFSAPKSSHFKALVFNLSSDPYLGRLSFIKIYSGSIKEGDTITNLSNGSKERIRDIYRICGEKQEKVGKAEAGEIVALTKLESISLGDTLTLGDDAKLEPLTLPKPVFPRALRPQTQADEEKMSEVLKELAETKATISIYRDNVTKEAIILGMGDTHLAVFAERLKNRYGVAVRMDRPLVPYKETVQKVATGQYRHKKQTGGRGQFGEVHLRIEPLERGAGFEFVDEIKGGVIPSQFIPGVEKGVVEAMERGILAGYPLTDIKVAVYDGKHHPVDSSEIAFKIAASKAFQIATQNAQPVLLEPVWKLIVWTPQEFTGDIMSSLSGKRGRILGMEPEEGKDRIEAEAPLAEIQDYALELKSITQGRATFQMEFLKYQPVTSEKLAEELLRREKRD